MTKPEFNLEKAKLEAELAKLEVAAAKIKMEKGYVKLQADFEKEYELLKNDFATAQTQLQLEELWVTYYKDLKDRGPYKDED